MQRFVPAVALLLSLSACTSPSEPWDPLEFAGTYHLTDSLAVDHWVVASGSELTITRTREFVWTSVFAPTRREGTWSVFDDTRGADTGYVRLLLNDPLNPPLWFVLRGEFSLEIPLPHAVDIVVRHPTGSSAYLFSRSGG